MSYVAGVQIVDELNRTNGHRIAKQVRTRHLRRDLYAITPTVVIG